MHLKGFCKAIDLFINRRKYHFVNATSQWVTTSYYNALSHWLGHTQMIHAPALMFVIKRILATTYSCPVSMECKFRTYGIYKVEVQHICPYGKFVHGIFEIHPIATVVSTQWRNVLASIKVHHRVIPPNQKTHLTLPHICRWYNYKTV